jgi:hypothetical protein
MADRTESYERTLTFRGVLLFQSEMWRASPSIRFGIPCHVDWSRSHALPDLSLGMRCGEMDVPRRHGMEVLTCNLGRREKF